jgi:hypothetical protein
MHNNRLLIDRYKFGKKYRMKTSYSCCSFYDLFNSNLLFKRKESTRSLPARIEKQISIKHFIKEAKYYVQLFSLSSNGVKIQTRQRKCSRLKLNDSIYVNDSRRKHRPIFNLSDTKLSARMKQNVYHSTKSHSIVRESSCTSAVIVDIGMNSMHDNVTLLKGQKSYDNRHRSPMNIDRTRATLCLIHQLNAYMDSQSLLTSKEINESKQCSTDTQKVHSVYFLSRALQAI